MINQKLYNLTSTQPLQTEKKVSHYLRGDVVLPIHTKTARALCQGSWRLIRRWVYFNLPKR